MRRDEPKPSYTCKTCGETTDYLHMVNGKWGCWRCNTAYWPDRDTEPARITRADVGVERGCVFTLSATFDFGGRGQGLGYVVDQEFVERFIKACGKEYLQECVGRIVYVTRTWTKIYRIDPMPFDREGAVSFDIEAWAEKLQATRKEATP